LLLVVVRVAVCFFFFNDTATTEIYTLEEIARAATGPLWYQLYVYRDRSLARNLVHRAEAAGYRAICLTVDTPILGSRERDVRNKLTLPAGIRMRNFEAAGLGAATAGVNLHEYAFKQLDASLTWDAVEWLRGETRLPLILKGIIAPEDGALAAERGVDGIVVSNHGGRQLDGTEATLRALPRVADAVAGRAEVFVDGGVRRGTDVVKVRLGQRRAERPPGPRGSRGRGGGGCRTGARAAPSGAGPGNGALRLSRCGRDRPLAHRGLLSARGHGMNRMRFGTPFLLLLLAASAPAASPDASVVPDIGRYFDTWLWVKSEGMVATSTPETRGAARTLILNSDLSYEFHQRRDTRDSVVCRGRFYFSEESGEGNTPTDYLDFEGWFEPYEHRMTTDFVGRDTLTLAGDPCENCPEHMFVRGRTATFEASVTRGDHYRRGLWDGLALELDPTEGGWEICIRDSTRPSEDLARLTPPFHSLPDPRDIDASAPQRSRRFIFSREVGRSIRPAGSSGEVTEDEVARVEDSGRGALDIEDMVLTPPKKGERAKIQSMRFRVAIEEVHP
jgi:hypothetical protein